MMDPHERRMHFLARLIKKHNLINIVELGVRSGDTYFFLLEKCPGIRLVGVDIWDKIPYQYSKNQLTDWPNTKIELAVRSRAKHFGMRAMLLKGLTDDVVVGFIDASLDLIFIDADHTYDSVSKDILNWRPKLRRGGFLTGHDIDWPGVKKAVDEHIINYDIGPDNVWYVQV